MATTSFAPLFTHDGSLSPQLIEYLEAMEERIVSRLLAALRPTYEAGAPEQTLAKMVPVVVASTSPQRPRESSSKQTRSRSAAITPRPSQQYKDVTQNPKCAFEELCTAFKVLKPHQTFDEYYLDVASKKPLPSLPKAEEHILLHAPRVVSVLDYASNIPLPDITSDEEFSDDSSDDMSLFSSVSSCSTFTTEAPMSPEFDQAIDGVEDSTELYDAVGDDKSTPAEVKAPIDAVSAEPPTTIEPTRAPQSNDGATDPPVTEYNNEDDNDNNGTVHVAAAGVRENQPNTHQQTHSTDITDCDVSTSELSIVFGAASQTEAMEVCIPEPAHSRPVDSQNTRPEFSQTMDGIESPPAPRDTSGTEQDGMDDVQVTSRVDTEEQNMVDAPPPESTTESRARSRVKANTSNHWWNGKVNCLLELIPDLHLVLKQDLPKMIQERQTNQIPHQIFGYIDNATSARGLGNDLESAMKNKLLTNAQFNKLEKYAKGERVVIPKVSNYPTKDTGSSTTAANTTAQSATPPAAAQTSIVGASVTGPKALIEEEPTTSEPESIKERFTRLLCNARAEMLKNNEDPALEKFRGLFNISFQKLSDTDVVIDYLIKHPRYKGRDSDGRPQIDMAKTVDIIQALYNDLNPHGKEQIVWRCMEALAAQDVKAENEELSGFIRCAHRQKPLEMLYRSISTSNFALKEAVNGDGALSWDDMKDLAKKEERQYFEDRSRMNDLPKYREYMKERGMYWSNMANMKGLVAQQVADRDPATGQVPATDSVDGAEAAGPSKGKRSLADIPHDDDEQDLKRLREEPAELTEEEERAARKRGARGPADSESSERVKRSRD
ncbi:hypothetical protein J4E83_008695 [Alternaria metachromatica]|uniref:uncharacterized protein n=1 Tax=Alternaria metachromatica TaxID=283354 RepID=UPI0020C44750|nr:uncharacterized protein J4E83_008695 [Alternaria metachromatica]KAI4609525.1 hypothetical protein J4E83_008695 [Alternaria metachromatica]